MSSFKQGAKHCCFERWSDVALLEVMQRRIVFSKVALERGICFAGVNIWISISSSLETGVAGYEESEVVPVFVGLRDCGPVACLFLNSFG
ncbi:hypothetical protein F511_37332 [Dorcoceras hygrometricum]|uniref:Uncharacterized protein n=1 Tax=Dorcoceras hygrometricum TaxID=472368 RepID=A0A2Z7C2B2_9LAMI|nr:hypothetical protein F511_37332 [Dorcoceras hygrometricum]